MEGRKGGSRPIAGTGEIVFSDGLVQVRTTCEADDPFQLEMMNDEKTMRSLLNMVCWWDGER